jgi:serine/threonine-protein kinase
LGALAALFLLNEAVIPRAVRHGQDIEVPNVVGVDQETALATLREHGLGGRRAAERIAPEWPEGIVLDQSLPAKFRTRGGRAVDLTVSLGRGDVSVPEIGGESVRHAEMILERSGLTIGNLVRAYGEASVGEILTTSPRIGARVARGDAVDLLLSRGRPGVAFMMPDFRGSDADAVARGLRKEGIIVDLVTSSGAPAISGRIIAQTPAPGYRIAPGSSAVLTVEG